MDWDESCVARYPKTVCVAKLCFNLQGKCKEMEEKNAAF